MALLDDLAAIDADAFGDKPLRKRAAKADAFIERMNGLLPHSWTRGAYVLTITAVRRNGWDIEVDLTLTKDGLPVTLSNPFVIVNIPCLIRDPAGTIFIGLRGPYREDVRQAVKDAIFDTVEGIIRRRQQG